MRQAFEKQLSDPRSVTCDGDYLGGRSREEVITELIRLDPMLPDPDSFIDRKIQEWKDHTGEHLLFFIARHRDEENRLRLEVMKCWEGDLSEMTKHWSLDLLPKETESTLPYLRKL